MGPRKETMRAMRRIVQGSAALRPSLVAAAPEPVEPVKRKAPKAPKVEVKPPPVPVAVVATVTPVVAEATDREVKPGGVMRQVYVRTTVRVGCRRGGSRCGLRLLGHGATPLERLAYAVSVQQLGVCRRGSASAYRPGALVGQTCASVGSVLTRPVYHTTMLPIGEEPKPEREAVGVSLDAMFKFMAEHDPDTALRARLRMERGGSLRDVEIMYQSVRHNVAQAALDSNAANLAWSNEHGEQFGKLRPGADMVQRRGGVVLAPNRPANLEGKARDDSFGAGQRWLRRK